MTKVGDRVSITCPDCGESMMGSYCGQFKFYGDDYWHFWDCRCRSCNAHYQEAFEIYNNRSKKMNVVLAIAYSQGNNLCYFEGFGMPAIEALIKDKNLENWFEAKPVSSKTGEMGDLSHPPIVAFLEIASRFFELCMEVCNALHRMFV